MVKNDTNINTNGPRSISHMKTDMGTPDSLYGRSCFRGLRRIPFDTTNTQTPMRVFTPGGTQVIDKNYCK